MTSVRGLKSPERAAMLATARTGRLIRRNQGWETRHRIFQNKFIEGLVALGYGQITGKRFELTAAGEERAAHERTVALGHVADRLTEKETA